MPNLIESVRIKGFRSLADVALDNLPRATVLIGPNGSGKSNFIRFFEMMSWMTKRQLAEFVARRGGADDQLFGGSKKTKKIEAQLALRTEAREGGYRFVLSYAAEDRFIFTEEACRFSPEGREIGAVWRRPEGARSGFIEREGAGTEAEWQHLGRGFSEAQIVKIVRLSEAAGADTTPLGEITRLLRRCGSYQFHDTSGDSNFKKRWDAEDSTYLRADGGNLAAILYRLENEDPRRFDFICRYIRRALPIFDRFEIEESYGKVLLRWKPKGMDKTIGAHLTSDGSLRLFALVTLLNLPLEMLPDVLLLDEPELGLHPAAVGLIGDMIKSLAEDRQVIAATQSPLLVDEFDLDEIGVLELRDGRTQVRRFDREKYERWLENYSTGQLWEKNVLGGRP